MSTIFEGSAVDKKGDPLGCILFSYNRAIQLDLTLRSLFDKMVNPLTCTVIYHYTEGHRSSYETLMDEWSQRGVCFKQRDDRYRGLGYVWPYLLRFDNLYWYLRYPFMRKRMDNFKELVEEVIADLGLEFVFFSTDDQYLLAPTYVPRKALDIVARQPRDYCYRFFTGNHFTDECRLPEHMLITTYCFDELGQTGEFFE